ncbi:2-phosphosulfolactate phosphatase [Ectobacillus ponti]|uniref:Probable 2-phosphosulfolactate phosphatase n=1 Tax=Ectobacillus ponti TaxID=2961894 RepID=A0AA41X5E2_9BACI|nr:2-phosphosulfolactate phosphatase [Ectobacillus ponti]MCP8969007.1 2-phosphosulfolactate phosphatase [Ectobacillus ponti]
MGRLHVIMRKEDIDPKRVEEKVAVVLDILIATTMITSAFRHGAKQVVPVRTQEEALEAAVHYSAGEVLAAGEYQGRAVEGLLLPNPTELQAHLPGKTFVLSTTNGTVAISKAAGAKALYAASLLNGAAVARRIGNCHPDDTILIICSGSGGSVALEDLYGAGYLISCLLEQAGWELTDSACAALFLYEGKKGQAEEVLRASRVGRALVRGGYEKEVRYAAQCGMYGTVPQLQEGTILMEVGETWPKRT